MPQRSSSSVQMLDFSISVLPSAVISFAIVLFLSLEVKAKALAVPRLNIDETASRWRFPCAGHERRREPSGWLRRKVTTANEDDLLVVAAGESDPHNPKGLDREKGDSDDTTEFPQDTTLSRYGETLKDLCECRQKTICLVRICPPEPRSRWIGICLGPVSSRDCMHTLSMRKRAVTVFTAASVCRPIDSFDACRPFSKRMDRTREGLPLEVLLRDAKLRLRVGKM